MGVTNIEAEAGGNRGDLISIHLEENRHGVEV
jgi:hypothetical protein